MPDGSVARTPPAGFLTRGGRSAGPKPRTSPPARRAAPEEHRPRMY
ncbi:hypothetical protein STXM2123_430 [Streptomyces sp. F-3]|nr:hypothetical protein STXM2123_430 [Streptomyces sp. F-3]